MNSPTPETDALRDSLWNLVERTSVSFHVEQFLKLARKLERERDEAKREIIFWIESDKRFKELQETRAERDQLRKVADAFATSVFNRDIYGIKPAVELYNQLPHVQERNK